MSHSEFPYSLGICPEHIEHFVLKQGSDPFTNIQTDSEDMIGNLRPEEIHRNFKRFLMLFVAPIDHYQDPASIEKRNIGLLSNEEQDFVHKKASQLTDTAISIATYIRRTIRLEELSKCDCTIVEHSEGASVILKGDSEGLEKIMNSIEREVGSILYARVAASATQMDVNELSDHTSYIEMEEELPPTPVKPFVKSDRDGGWDIHNGYGDDFQLLET